MRVPQAAYRNDRGGFRDFPGAGPGNSIFIGDSLSDMECGRAAGMATILIDNAMLEDRKPGAEVARPIADATAESLGDAVHMLL